MTTREDVEQALKDGKYVSYHVWTFWQRGYTCGSEEGCCEDYGLSLEEVMSTIGRFSGNAWEDVKIDD